MKWPFILLEICRGTDDPLQPCPHSSEVTIIYHFSSIFRWICIITIHHNICFCIYLPKHSSDHIAFPLHILVPFTIVSCFFCDHRCIIIRIVVIHIDYSLGSSFFQSVTTFLIVCASLQHGIKTAIVIHSIHPLNLSLFQKIFSGHKIENHYHRCSYYFLLRYKADYILHFPEGICYSYKSVLLRSRS